VAAKKEKSVPVFFLT